MNKKQRKKLVNFLSINYEYDYLRPKKKKKKKKKSIRFSGTVYIWFFPEYMIFSVVSFLLTHENTWHWILLANLGTKLQSRPQTYGILTYFLKELVNYDLLMLFEILNLQIDRFYILPVAILFSQTNLNGQEFTQPENKSKNKKPPACIVFLKKVSENLITFFFGLRRLRKKASKKVVIWPYCIVDWSTFNWTQQLE